MKRIKIIPLLILFLSLTAPSLVVPRSIRHYTEPEPAPGFNLPDLDGVTHRLADYQGRVVIVNFWATWCRPCVKEMPSLESAKKQLQRDEIEVVTINVGDTADQIRAFLKHRPLDLQILLDLQSEVMVSWNVLAMPTSFVLDPTGKIVMRVIGEYQWDTPDLLDQIRTIR